MGTAKLPTRSIEDSRTTRGRDVEVSICVCTYKRPDGIQLCLSSLVDIARCDAGDLEIIVVDNDPEGSARAVVEDHQLRSAVPVRYFVEHRSGVSFARNRCIQESRGSLVAFVDDDEWVTPRWLVAMKTMQATTQAGAVLGPVLPRFDTEPASWLIDSGLFDRPRHPSGRVVHWGNGRTGNVLFVKSMIIACGGFDLTFAGTGGEDLRLFLELHNRLSAKLVWCDEAEVFERVPPARITPSFLLLRGFLGGRTVVRVLADSNGKREYLYWIIRALCGLPVNALMAAASLVRSRGQAFRYLERAAGDAGKLTSVVPFSVRRYGSGG